MAQRLDINAIKLGDICRVGTCAGRGLQPRPQGLGCKPRPAQKKILTAATNFGQNRSASILRLRLGVIRNWSVLT